MKDFLLAAFLLAATAATTSAQEIAEMMERVGYDQNIGAQLPLDARFRDEAGRELALGDLFGERPVILAFVYYECPMLCTLVLNGLVRSLRRVTLEPGEDFDVIAIGIDPDEEPGLALEVQRSYLEAYGRPETAGGWHFLTGNERDIRRVADVAGFRYVYVEDKDEYAHASGVLVVTPEGVLSRYFYGVEYPSRDLRFALVESASGGIGGLVDQVLLLCFSYDPLTGRYGPSIMNAIRLLGGLTVLLLGVYITRSLRRGRLEPVKEVGG